MDATFLPITMVAFRNRPLCLPFVVFLLVRQGQRTIAICITILRLPPSRPADVSRLLLFVFRPVTDGL